jgi:hypothetical protein
MASFEKKELMIKILIHRRDRIREITLSVLKEQLKLKRVLQKAMWIWS